jgi:hypothetical protein
VTQNRNHRSVRASWMAYVAAGVCGTLVGCFLALVPYRGL